MKRPRSKDAARIEPASPGPSAGDMRRLKERLAAAKRPLVLIGGSGWSTTAAKQLAAFAGRFDIPVAATFRRQDHLDNRHASYVGHAGVDIDQVLGAAIAGADVLIVIGETPGEVPTRRADADRGAGSCSGPRARASFRR